MRTKTPKILKSVHYIFMAVMLLCASPVWGKVRIAGRVSDPAGEGAAGAMIKAMNGRKVGAYALANEDGRYELVAADSILNTANVEISCMGFAKFSVPLADLVKNPDVVMQREVSQLEEFTVKGKGTKVNHPDWIAEANIYEADLRHASQERNLEGFTRRLPDLLEMGVNVVILNPIHPISKKGRRGSLGSPYAAADYTEVNPEFGTLDDLKRFVSIAHMIGMRVIIDEPIGFSGMDHPWVKQHPEYYARTEGGDLVIPPGRPDVYKYDYDNPEWRRAIIGALSNFVKETDIDGFRFPESDRIPYDFWDRARKTVQHVKPVMFIADSSDPALLKDAFDADYNKGQSKAFAALASGYGLKRGSGRPDLTSAARGSKVITDYMNAQAKSYPKGSLHLNMTENLALRAIEGTEADRYGDAARAFAVLAYTLPGIPMMSMGQEVGLERRLNQFDSDAVPDYKSNYMTEFYTKLNLMRTAHPALWQEVGKKPSFRLIETTSPHILAFEREKGDDCVMVFVNLSDEPQDLNFPGVEPYMKGLENQIYPFIREIPAQLQPWEYQVFATEVENGPGEYIYEIHLEQGREALHAAFVTLRNFFQYWDAKAAQDKQLHEMLDQIRKGRHPKLIKRKKVRKEMSKPRPLEEELSPMNRQAIQVIKARGLMK